MHFSKYQQQKIINLQNNKLCITFKSPYQYLTDIFPRGIPGETSEIGL